MIKSIDTNVHVPRAPTRASSAGTPPPAATTRAARRQTTTPPSTRRRPPRAAAVAAMLRQRLLAHAHVSHRPPPLSRPCHRHRHPPAQGVRGPHSPSADGPAAHVHDRAYALPPPCRPARRRPTTTRPTRPTSRPRRSAHARRHRHRRPPSANYASKRRPGLARGPSAGRPRRRRRRSPGRARCGGSCWRRRGSSRRGPRPLRRLWIVWVGVVFVFDSISHLSNAAAIIYI